MVDYSKAIEIAKDIYWVGSYIKDDVFQCHTYLIVDGNESVIIDSGSMLEYEVVKAKIESITSLKNIKYIIAHHQDPDVCANIPAFEKIINRNDLLIVTHPRNIPLIKHYGIKSLYYDIEKNNYKLTTKNYTLNFITTPYSHAPGAFVTYNVENKVLFSSDIFGALEESWHFWASGDYFDKIKLFHEQYMPSQDILFYSLSKIEQLDLNLIAPQHGSLIKKELIPSIIKDLQNLECGLYIQESYKNSLIYKNKKLQEKVLAQAQNLKKLNEDLEIRIKEEVKKNLIIKEKLFQAEKLASLGEMIGNIAHQWRQPLSVISTVATGMKLEKEYGMLNDEKFFKNCDLINENAQYLSQTIDDFRDFIKGDRVKEKINLKKLIESFLHLVESSIKLYNINIILDIKNIVIQGYANQLNQCLINIFNNAKDIFNERNINEKYIFISIDKKDNKAIISIKDNGGGVPEDIINKIFEPYFTTKHKSQGTGLGLSMVYKLIIAMNGEIEVKNVDFSYNNKQYSGAEFIISLPIN